MTSRRLASLAALVLSVSCGAPNAAPPRAAAPAAPAADDAAIDAAEKAYVDAIVADWPEEATALGLHARDTELDEYTLGGRGARIAHAQAMLDDLRARFAAPRASVPKQIDLEVLEHRLAVDVRRDHEVRPLERLPETYLGPLHAIFTMIAHEYAPAPARAAAIVARLEKIPGVIAAAKANLKNPPAIWTQVGIESARQASPFLDQVKAFVDTNDKGDVARADRAVAAARAAYADYAAFLEKDVLPRSNGDFAAGKSFFEFLLHEDYFLDEDADAIAALGQRIFDRTDAEMTAVAKRIDPAASGWPEVLARLKTKHPTADDLIPSFRREVARARAFLVAKDAVPLPPDDVCEVLETPPFERNTVTAAYDEAPPFDAHTTKGIFFVTPVDASLTPKEQEDLLKENNHADAVDTVVHETYPGHHLQLSFARRVPSLVRKATDTALFAEGWALYAEELMNELGYYTDEERLAQLQWTLVRAARVMIDVGLHTKGMTFDQAVAILTDRVHLEKVLAVNEVKRYTSTPTQPLSYLVGREQIFALREKRKQVEGAAFSLKRFHGEVLAHGSIPPALVAREIAAE